jgi:hypothetical protein
MSTAQSTGDETESQHTRRRAQEAVQEAIDRRDNGGDGAAATDTYN